MHTSGAEAPDPEVLAFPGAAPAHAAYQQQSYPCSPSGPLIFRQQAEQPMLPRPDSPPASLLDDQPPRDVDQQQAELHEHKHRQTSSAAVDTPGDVLAKVQAHAVAQQPPAANAQAQHELLPAMRRLTLPQQSDSTLAERPARSAPQVIDLTVDAVDVIKLIDLSGNSPPSSPRVHQCTDGAGTKQPLSELQETMLETNAQSLIHNAQQHSRSLQPVDQPQAAALALEPIAADALEQEAADSSRPQYTAQPTASSIRDSPQRQFDQADRRVDSGCADDHVQPGSPAGASASLQQQQQQQQLVHRKRRLSKDRELDRLECRYEGVFAKPGTRKRRRTAAKGATALQISIVTQANDRADQQHADDSQPPDGVSGDAEHAKYAAHQLPAPEELKPAAHRSPTPEPPQAAVADVGTPDEPVASPTPSPPPVASPPTPPRSEPEQPSLSVPRRPSLHSSSIPGSPMLAAATAPAPGRAQEASGMGHDQGGSPGSHDDHHHPVSPCASEQHLHQSDCQAGAQGAAADEALHMRGRAASPGAPSPMQSS